MSLARTERRARRTLAEMRRAFPPPKDNSPPGVHVVVITPGFPNIKLRNTLVRALYAMAHPTILTTERALLPITKSNSVSAKRLHYSPHTSKLIVNTAAKRMHKVLGKHCVALAVEADNRDAAARRAWKVFVKAGYKARVHTHAEPEFPDGFIVFVSVPALEGIVLIAWPTATFLNGRGQKYLKKIPRRQPVREKDLRV